MYDTKRQSDEYQDKVTKFVYDLKFWFLTPL